MHLPNWLTQRQTWLSLILSAAVTFNQLKQKEVYILNNNHKNLFNTELFVWETNILAVSLFKDTKIAALLLCATHG